MSTTKLEKLPRPTFSLDMTQSDYAFKESQWGAYIGQSVTSEQVKLQQLRAGCDEDLLRRVYDAGDLQGLNTEKDLLKQIKNLGVRVVPKTLHLQNMWQMKQDPEEPIRAFCSRLVGIADLCDLTVQCSSPSCSHKTSYRDQVVLLALLKGMHHVDIRTRVLSSTQNDELSKLPELVECVLLQDFELINVSEQEGEF